MEKFPINKIIASFEDRLSPVEQEQLQSWLKISDEHQQHYDELKKVYQSSEKISSNFVVDNQSALKKVNRRLAFRQAIRWTRRVAAALVIILLSAQLWYRIVPVNSSWQQIVAQEKHILFLPDSSKVVLAPNASLQYPKSFNHKIRKVVLTGEAYFEIKHDKQHPFVVQTRQTRVKVLGTRFLVDASSSEKEQVCVDEGKVAFRALKKWTQTPVLLTKNEKGTWNAASDQLDEQQNNQTNSNAWLSGRLTFTDTPLSKVIADVEALYNVNIELDRMLPPQMKYTGYFNNANLETVLNIIAMSFDVSVQKHDNQYLILP